MINTKLYLIRLSFSLALLSVSVISYQLLLIQILSIIQWHHFAYMVISIAMLGFGAAGTFISLFRNYLLERTRTLLPFLMILSSFIMGIAVIVSQTEFFRFDSYLLFAETSHIYKLIITYLIFFLPFFFSALAIGIIFVKYIDKIGTLYFVNMFGSGTGGITAVILMWIFFPEELPVVIAMLALIAGIFIMPKNRLLVYTIIIHLSVTVTIYFIIAPVELKVSEYKSISKTLNLPETNIIKRESSPFGLLEIITTPYLRYAPGLSIKYPGSVSVNNAAYNNGDWLGPLISFSSDTANYISYSTEMLPYIIDERENVLVLNSGTGRQINFALNNNAKQITAVEPNPALLQLLQNELQAEVDSVYNNKYVKLENTYPRTFIISSTQKYDLITLPVIDAFGGTSGMFSLQEQYLLTKESFGEMWDLLNTDGIISITTWIDYPYRNALKIIATIAEVLNDKRIINPAQHIAAIKNWNTITISVKKSPLLKEELDKIRVFCGRMNFDPVILPNLPQYEREIFNLLQDNSFYVLIDKILSSPEKRESVYNDYQFNVKPATDNQPYYSQFLMWKSIPLLADLFGNQSVAFFEVGYLLLYITFIQIIILAFLFIIVPLFKIGFKGGNKIRTLIYFSGLGLGYMFIEIILIQRFTLYFGNVIYAAASVVCLMLVSSGIGSFVSQKINLNTRSLIIILSIIIASLTIYTLFLSYLLKLTIGYELTTKIFLSTLIIAPPAFFMGMPFPLGLRSLALKNEMQIPWAWGINGMFSVIASVLAMIIAIEIGFVWVMVFAIAAYSLSLSI